jgi:hypothetical protein
MLRTSARTMKGHEGGVRLALWPELCDSRNFGATALFSSATRAFQPRPNQAQIRHPALCVLRDSVFAHRTCASSPYSCALRACHDAVDAQHREAVGHGRHRQMEDRPVQARGQRCWRFHRGVAFLDPIPQVPGTVPPSELEDHNGRPGKTGRRMRARSYRG